MLLACGAYAFGNRHNIHTLIDAGAILLCIGAFISIAGIQLPLRFLPAIGVLAFLIPIWPERRMQLAGPLQEATARITQDVCEMFGMVVERQGSNLLVNGAGIAIVEACNGMRMVLTLLLVCYAYAFVRPLGAWWRTFIIILSPGVAILCNVIRLVPTVWVYSHLPPPARDRFHDWSGWVMLAVALAFMAALTRLAQWVVADDSAPSPLYSAAGRVRTADQFPAPSMVRNADPTAVARIHYLLPPLLALLVLGVAWLDQHRIGPPPDAASYHANIRQASSQIPLQSGDWLGTDIPLPYDVIGALHANVLISRHYQNASTGQGVKVMLLQCQDALVLQDHFPPACYPNTQGYRLTHQYDRDWDVDELRVRGIVYEFSRRRFDASDSLVVADLMILPNRQFARDMSPVRRWASDVRSRFYGAGQMQILFDPQTSPCQRDDMVRAMLHIFAPVLNAIAAPVQAESHP